MLSASTLTKARTTAGSNCVPEQCCSSARASAAAVVLGGHAQEDLVDGLVGVAAAASLGAVHALVGDSQRVDDLRALRSEQHGAVRAADREVLAGLHDIGGGRDERAGILKVVRREQAELVAARPVGDRPARGRAGEVLAEPRQQRVAGGMAEGVVIGLEAVT